MLDASQVNPQDAGLLREAKRARLVAVAGKGGMTRTVFLSADARTALADYLEHERPKDASDESRRCSCRPRVSRRVGLVGGSRHGRSTRFWSASGTGMTLSTATQLAGSARCARMICAIMWTAGLCALPGCFRWWGRCRR